MPTIINPSNLSSQTLLIAPSLKPKSEEEKNLSEDKSNAKEGVEVTLSVVGLLKSSKSSNDNSDIENSGLPDSIQRTIKMIREIKKQISETKAKLQAVMTNASLSPEDARIKAGNLQSQLSTLNGSLSIANTALSKQMKSMDLPSDQMMTAVALAVK